MLVPAGGSIQDITATCPAGTVLTGGGVVNQLQNDDIHWTASAPDTSTNSWHVSAYNSGATPQTVQSYAVCIPATTA
ncbi:hypothetical protein GCM10015535_43120 [Streptomyces gelaticus]|uniref:Uncharacterized protein n=1 Tax=Streptomyces gelaticus TaxID=285446 RepID=A0ABQ2W1V2_9ACTN|nr:hypothetical protein [Streptomyces gelaticus]GGV89429.1 hypothetical protein GCM10015535_43120 [Streptomyces gelaticus]